MDDILWWVLRDIFTTELDGTNAQRIATA